VVGCCRVGATIASDGAGFAADGEAHNEHPYQHPDVDFPVTDDGLALYGAGCDGSSITTTTIDRIKRSMDEHPSRRFSTRQCLSITWIIKFAHNLLEGISCSQQPDDPPLVFNQRELLILILKLINRVTNFFIGRSYSAWRSTSTAKQSTNP
jgi:hypothetical protein